MPCPNIDQKIRYGYAKAAEKLGQSFSLYRAPNPIDPIQEDNLIGVLPAVVTQSWNWMKGNRPGNAIWYLVVDGRESTMPLSAKENDYLIGDGVFFVMSKEYQMPMQAVECNAFMHIRRPYQSLDPGGQGYAGYEAPDATLLFRNVPGSILIKHPGKTASTALPTDTNQPTWIVQLPNLGDVQLRIGDVLETIEFQNTGSTLIATPPPTAIQSYLISGNEETEFGWRFIVHQQVN